MNTLSSKIHLLYMDSTKTNVIILLNPFLNSPDVRAILTTSTEIKEGPFYFGRKQSYMRIIQFPYELNSISLFLNVMQSLFHNFELFLR